MDIPLRLPCKTLFTDGAMNGEVIKAYMVGGIAASNQVALTPQVMVSGKISTTLVVPASRPVVVSPTRLGAANGMNDNGAALDACRTALAPVALNACQTALAPVALEDGTQSNVIGDNFWDDSEERINWGGAEYEHNAV